MSLSSGERLLQEAVWQYYHDHGRGDLPWRRRDERGSINPYHVVVSELMLQQTQVSRVVPKYQQFIEQYPGLMQLAQASQADVLRSWSGLGYNRRARYLHLAARQLVSTGNGRVPDSIRELTQLPGIGVNTAGAIIVYAFNKPAIFVETNIRTVYLSLLFPDQDQVSDRELARAVERTLPDSGEYRDWYWALMDYGSYLKKRGNRVNDRSASYVRQKAFQGSRREIRGKVLRLLTQDELSLEQLQNAVADERLTIVLEELLHEQLVRYVSGRYSL